MGLKCRISYEKGVAKVTDESGNPSGLYSNILSLVQDQDKALNVWATAYEKDFGAKGEDASVVDLVKYFDSKVAVEESLNPAEKIQVEDFMKRNGFSRLSTLHSVMMSIFKPNGFFQINPGAAVASGLYSQEELRELDPSQVEDILLKMEGQLLKEDLKVDPYIQNYTHKNSERKTIFGTNEVVSNEEIDRAIIEAVDTFTDVESFYNSIKNLPYPEFVYEFMNNDAFANSIMQRFQDLKKIPRVSMVNGELSAENNEAYTTTKNTMLSNADNVQIQADISFLEGIPQDLWEQNQEDVVNVLKEIEESLIDVNIDVIGISDNSFNRQEVLMLLEAANNLLTTPSENTLQAFANIHKATIEPSQRTITAAIPSKYVGYNIVSLHSQASEVSLFNEHGLIKVGENLFHNLDQTADVNEVKDYIYSEVREGRIEIPSKFRLTKDINNKPGVLEDISRFLMSRPAPAGLQNQELYSAYQVAFQHDPVTVKTEDAKGLLRIRTNEEYLKTSFVSDFYNYILREKFKNSDIYKNVLSKFEVNDRDLSLMENINSIDNLEFNQELRDYIALKKDSNMKYLIDTTDSMLTEDALYLNFPEKKMEYDGDMIVDGNYIVTTPISDNYIKLNGQLYRKEMVRDGANLFARISTPQNTTYYTSSLNFEFNRSEGKAVLDKYGTLQPNTVDHTEFQNIVAKSRINDSMRSDLQSFSTLKDKSYVFFNVNDSIVAYKDGVRVGTIRPDRTSDGYADPKISVTEIHRGKGIGTELYLRLFDKIGKEGKVLYPSAVRTKQAQNIFSRLENMLEKTDRGGFVLKEAGRSTQPTTGTLSRSIGEMADSRNRRGLVPVSELVEFIGEDRLGDAAMTTSRETIDRLKDDILKNGFKEPITVVYDKLSNGGEAAILEGNHRIAAAMELELKEIPTRFEKGALRSDEQRAADNMFPLNRKFVGEIDTRLGVDGTKLGLTVRPAKPTDFVTDTRFQGPTLSPQIVPKEIFDNVVGTLQQNRLSAGPVVADRSGFVKGLRKMNMDNKSAVRFSDVNGFLHEGTVYVNPEQLNVNTPIHEFGHLWYQWAEKHSPELTRKGRQLVEGSPYYDLIKALSQDSESVYYNNTEEEILEEALVMAIGDKGEQFVNKEQKSSFQQWLSDLWMKLQNALGLSEMSQEQFEELTLDDFAEAVGIDLLKGRGAFDGTNSFEAWKGDNKYLSGSSLQDAKTGEPIVAEVYHGTTHEFYEFDSTVKGTVEGHLGRMNYFTSDIGDAEMNYTNDGGDLKQRVENRMDQIESEIEYEYTDDSGEIDTDAVMSAYDLSQEEMDKVELHRLAEYIANKELMGGESQVLELYVKLNNPLVLGSGQVWHETIPEDSYSHNLEDATEAIAERYDITEEEAKEDYNWEIKQEAIEMSSIWENPMVTAMQQALNDNASNAIDANEVLADMWETEIDLNELEQNLRESEALLYAEGEEGLLSSHIIAQFFKNLGFDGILLTDVSNRFPGMGLGSSATHVHVFDEYSNQIKLSDGSNFAFRGTTRDIRFHETMDPSPLNGEFTRPMINSLLTNLRSRGEDYAIEVFEAIRDNSSTDNLEEGLADVVERVQEEGLTVGDTIRILRNTAELELVSENNNAYLSYLSKIGTPGLGRIARGILETRREKLENTSAIFDSKLELLDLYSPKEEAQIVKDIDSCG